MTEARKLAAILVSDIVGFSRLAGADEDRILARLRTLRSDLIDPTISVHRGRVVKRTGDGSIVEFRSVVDAVRCAIELQQGLVERNAGLPPERRIEFRVGIHLGDVVEESDGDLMGDGVNIAARLEGIAKPGAICLSEDAYRQVKGRLDLTVSDLGDTELKNIAEPIRVYSLEVGQGARRQSPRPGFIAPKRPARRACRSWSCPSPVWAATPEHEHFRRRGHREPDDRSLAYRQLLRRRAQHRLHLQGQAGRREADRTRTERSLHPRGQHSARRQSNARQRPAHRRSDRQSSVGGALRQARRRSLRLAGRDRFPPRQSVAPESCSTPKLVGRRTEANPDSVDLYFRGVVTFNKGGMDNIGKRPRTVSSEAVELDPTNIDALVGSARVDAVFGAIYNSAERAERLAAAEAMLVKGISIAPRNYWAHLWLGFIEILTNRASRGIGELEQTLALNKNIGAAHAWIGLAKIALGRAEETEAHVNEAFRISPTDGAAFLWNNVLGLAKLHLGADEEAVANYSVARSTPIATFRSTISTTPRRSRISAASTRPEQRSKPGWRSRRVTQSPTIAMHCRKRQPDLSRPARAHPRGSSQSRNSGGLTDGSLSFYKG